MSDQGKRRVRIYNKSGGARLGSFSDLKIGDVFDVVESDGEVMKNGEGYSLFVATSDPYPSPDYKGRMCIQSQIFKE